MIPPMMMGGAGNNTQGKGKGEYWVMPRPKVVLTGL